MNLQIDWDDPIDEEHRKRLLIKQNSLEDKGTHAHLRYEYAEMLAEAIGDRLLWKHYLETVKRAVSKNYGISLTEAECSAEYEWALVEFAKKEVEVIKLKEFIRSLDSKANFIPGLQGQRNQYLKFETMNDY